MAAGSVTKAVAILRYLAGARPSGVNAIARAVEISPSSCFNILKALVAEEFVAFDTRNKLYEIGEAPAKIFQTDTVGNSWTRWIHNECAEIAREFQTTVGIWRVWNDRLVLTDVLQSASPTGVHLSLGQRMPKYLGALGRCVAAHERLSLDRVADALAQLSWHDAPDAEDYFADMERAQQQRWAMDDGQYLGGVTSIAASISGRTHVQYGVTSFTLRGQHDATVVEQIGNRLAALAQETERRLNLGRYE